VPCPVPDRAEWKEEVTAQANCAACQAFRDFDPDRRVGLPVFVRERVLAAVWTMYRREKLRHARFGGDERLAEVAAPPAPEGFPIMTPLLSAALDRLPGPAKQLLVQIFWERRPISDIAAEARVTMRGGATPEAGGAASGAG
jgi:DNA-directed RNA polymerase specialized sigma24 family protein